jgi:glutathione peroxidase
MGETIYDISVRKIDGGETTLGEYRGEVLLVVNVASRCGFTPQYEGLEDLYEKYRDRRFQVLGFPANDFLDQEPGSDEEIRQFCSTNFQVRFPLFSKIVVTGPDKHPLYRHLTAARPETEGRAAMESNLRSHKLEPTSVPEVIWNFEKFLLNRRGEVVRRFSPDTPPDASALVQAVEAELAKD